MIHYFLGYVTVIWGDSFAGAGLFDHISSQQHLHYFAKGLIDTRAIVYYLSAAVFVLFLTYQVVDFRRWRTLTPAPRHHVRPPATTTANARARSTAGASARCRSSRSACFVIIVIALNYLVRSALPTRPTSAAPSDFSLSNVVDPPAR